MAVLTGCGYHIGGHSDLLPKNITTIAIPAFQNATTRYKLTDRIPAAIAREFISRSRYRIVADTNSADAIVRGLITNYFAYPTIFDPASGRASSVQISVVMQVSLIERATGKILFSRPSLVVNQRYEISVDQKAYFEESDVALERVSRDVARTVVSAILESF